MKGAQVSMAGKTILEKEEVIQIERAIKGLMAGSGSNATDTMRRLNEKYGTSETPQAFIRQLKTGTIPYWKVLRIASLFGYKVIFEEK